MESKGFEVAVFNRTVSRVDAFMAGVAKDKNIIGAPFRSRTHWKVRQPSKNYLDGESRRTGSMRLLGNWSRIFQRATSLLTAETPISNDTVRRHAELAEQDILFIGTGISGGEEGALKGPAMMPGGSLRRMPS